MPCRPDAPNNPADAVRTCALTRLFATTPALVRVNVSVGEGELCALVGGNGAGKTTLLRVLATALAPSAGKAFVHGREVRRQAHEVRCLTELLPSAGGLYADLTPRENLRFALTMRRLRAREAQIADSLERAGLARLADERVRVLSTGMQRRVGLARIMLTRRPLLLLDEPYAGLDEEGRGLVDAVLAEARAEGRTAIVATHERGRIAGIADVLHRLERGFVQETERLAPAQLPGRQQAGAPR